MPLKSVRFDSKSFNILRRTITHRDSKSRLGSNLELPRAHPEFLVHRVQTYRLVHLEQLSNECVVQHTRGTISADRHCTDSLISPKCAYGVLRSFAICALTCEIDGFQLSR